MRLRDEIRRIEANELGVMMRPTAPAPARAESQRAKVEHTRARAQRLTKARRHRSAGIKR